VALRFVSALVLAIALTVRIPDAGYLQLWDYVLMGYTACLAESMATMFCGGAEHADRIGFFALLDGLLFGLLLGLEGCAFTCATGAGCSDKDVQLTASQSLQAWGTLAGWLRLLELAFVLPNAGPKILTVFSLLNDLGGTGTVVLFVLFAFTCAFSVLTHDASVPRDATFSARMANVMTLLLGVTLNGEPLTISEHFAWTAHAGGALFDVSPFDVDGASQLNRAAPDWVGFMLMAVFGLAVVILMLNMVIASFARIVDRQDENIDANYKLKFAQAVAEASMRMRSSQLVPPPFNLFRRLTLALYRPLRIRHQRVAEGAKEDRAMADLLTDPTELMSETEAASIDLPFEVDKFITRAVRDVKMFPDAVVAFAVQHEHIVNDDEESDALWRTRLNERIGEVKRASETSMAEMHHLLAKQQQTIKAQHETLQEMQRALQDFVAHYKNSAPLPSASPPSIMTIVQPPIPSSSPPCPTASFQELSASPSLPPPLPSIMPDVQPLHVLGVTYAARSEVQSGYYV